MRQLNYKLIVTDFDGTLANSKNGVDEGNIKAINEFVESGGIFAVCTGRILPSILPRVRALGLKGLVIACQGSVIADIESGEILRDVSLTPQQTARVCRVLNFYGWNAQAYYSGGFFTTLEPDNKYLNLYESITAIKADHAEGELSSHIENLGIRCNKVATLCKGSEIEHIYQTLKGELGAEFDVTCSATVLVEISPLGETKGAAIEFLAAHYGVPMDRTCAIGDNLNDLSMIQTAAVGVAVGNSVQKLKDEADYVSSSNDECAVAEVIEKFGFM